MIKKYLSKNINVFSGASPPLKLVIRDIMETKIYYDTILTKILSNYYALLVSVTKLIYT